MPTAARASGDSLEPYAWGWGPTRVKDVPREHRKRMITVEHLRRTYGSFTAVDDLSFQVAPAEIVGLIGPNGAGKTTTLRSLAGILRPTAGHVRIHRHDLVQDPIVAKQRLAIMPDEPHLFVFLTRDQRLRLTDGMITQHK